MSAPTDRDLLEQIDSEIATFIALAWTASEDDITVSFLNNLRWKIDCQRRGERWWEDDSKEEG